MDYNNTISILPFITIFRLFEEIAIISRTVSGLSKAQNAIETGVEIEKQVSDAVGIEKQVTKSIKETNKVTRISRSTKFTRYFRIFGRMPRFAKAAKFFDHPKDRKE